MAKSEKQKLKLLYLKDYLEQYTDPDHPASIKDILDYLAQFGIRAERKSIYSDVQYLMDYGMDIEVLHGRGGGYYVNSRQFELPELKLLVDAVQSSKFLTQRKSMALIKKLAGLSSLHEQQLLKRQVVVSGRVKTMNESIYYNVDTIHSAIAENRQISFTYSEWGLDRKRHAREGIYTASPFLLIWDDENYYLVAHSEKHGLTHYRVDKMDRINLLSSPRTMLPEHERPDPTVYSKQVFNMFSGEKTQVKLRFDNSLVGVVIDRFGSDIMLIPDGPDHFIYTADIAVSPLFLGWLAGFGGRAKILFPNSLIDQYKAFCAESLAQYQ
ncbi:MAG: WYL domain-containing protein [Clostridia bacterium]|nr:WYL domain-containing protein [Clostridia bacterium]